MPGQPPEPVLLALQVNGERRIVAAAQHRTLLEVLREDLALTGTKHGCDLGECGACTVLLDEKPVLACLVLAIEAQGRDVQTVEGLAAGGQLHPLQQAFAELGAAQCGYCTPGMLMSARALLAERPLATREVIQQGLSGNLCRCTGYEKILDAVALAGRRMASAPAAALDQASMPDRVGPLSVGDSVGPASVPASEGARDGRA
ncbi:MAG: (2Fe-2S)-binding protein [Candidatus Sericytochromatia bacterium]|nr:(2Fe-2S)-binding protein [Candidatus Tanganyikabacteria bacterium]